MKKYEAYKESGVLGVSVVPEKWKVVNFRYLIDILTDFTANGSFGDLGKNVNYLEEGISRLIRLTDLRANFKNKGIYLNEASHNYLKKSELFGGEILLANVGAYAGLAWIFEGYQDKASLGPNMFLLKFKDVLDKRFAYTILTSSYLHSQLLDKATSSAQPKLNKEDVKSCVIILPSVSEQTQIANYLDHKTTIIDALIKKKEQLITKLQAKRQAIINEAVTRGLNPNAKMKDSGIEWLGEIPNDWEVSRLAYMSEIIDPQPDHRAPKLEENGFPYLGIRDINPDGSINTETARLVELAAIEKQEQSFTIQDGDIVFGKVGTLANPKHIKLGGNRVALSATLVLIKTDNKLYNEFLKFSLDSEFIWNQINTVIVGATRPALGIQQIRKFKIIKPSDSDMFEIVSFLKKQTSFISNLLKLNKKHIKKLKSYRQSIIYEAVTGKIDVRDWQAPTNN